MICIAGEGRCNRPRGIMFHPRTLHRRIRLALSRGESAQCAHWAGEEWRQNGITYAEGMGLKFGSYQQVCRTSLFVRFSPAFLRLAKSRLRRLYPKGTSALRLGAPCTALRR